VNEQESPCPLRAVQEGHSQSFTAIHGLSKSLLTSSALRMSCSSQALDAGSIPVTGSAINAEVGVVLSLVISGAEDRRASRGVDCGTGPWLAYRVPRGQPVSAVKGVGLRWSLQ
jgi:hypothetical protein